jgi:tryptophan 2,3-dioxygenase
MQRKLYVIESKSRAGNWYARSETYTNIREAKASLRGWNSKDYRLIEYVPGVEIAAGKETDRAGC